MEMPMSTPQSEARKLVRRSKMYVPVNREKFVTTAWTRGADCIIIDLEDSVAPADKDSARKLVKDAIPLVKKGGADVQIRINRGLEEKDLEECVRPEVACLMIPKCESAEEIQWIDDLVAQLEKDRGLSVGMIQFHLIVESALGLIHMVEIAMASPRNVQINIGHGDLSVNMGFNQFAELDYEQYQYAESKMLFAARAANIQATGLGAQKGVDFSNIASNPEEILRACRNAQAMGYFGTSCVHPAWVKPINEGFKPADNEVAWARKIKETLDDAYRQGKGSVKVDGRMYDVAHWKHANNILERSERIARFEAVKAAAIAARGGIDQ
jgi:citrate lyase subunit beta/citryl-CoA lyase